MTLCEACENEPSSVVEPCDDPQAPYHVCQACHSRLLAHSLRPLEWFNLAKRHGCYQHLLHDDFYMEDGTADQPEQDVVDAVLLPAPLLSQVKGNPQRLLDYTITRWHFDQDTLIAWKQLLKQDIIVAISSRFTATQNVGIRGRILEICADSVGADAAQFIRLAWGEYPDNIDLVSLAQASASCLPFDEGYDLVVTALRRMPNERSKRDLMFSLAFFNSPRTLDWIEKNIYSPITESWGYLAASSALDWSRVKSWLNTGRPLSLVAIDALRAIQHAPTPFLKKRNIRLVNPPSKMELKECLAACAERDPVPRVQQRVNAILIDGNDITVAEAKTDA